LKLIGLAVLAALILTSPGPLTADQPSSVSTTSTGGLITVAKSVQPAQINPRGYGAPDRATVTITVRGDTTQGRLPLDLVFVIDRSATMDITAMRRAVEQILGLLSPQDRVALVSFADTARTDLDLVPATPENRAELLQLIDGFINQGKTACDDGVAQATSILAGGRSTALRTELLLTDGMCTHGHEPEAELEGAVAKGIAPFVIGVGNVSRTFPRKIEAIEGVEFFPSPAFFIDYFQQTLVEIIGLAGRELVLVERLPGYIRYEGEASEPPTGVDRDGDLVIEWRRDRLGLGESWQISFQVSAEKTGELALEAGGELQFKNPLTGSPMPPVPLPDVTIRVRNVPPVCGFTYEPEKPTTADDINFFDQSQDPFGNTIVSWRWDFGDGSGSSKRNPTHRYRRDGQYTVTLQVADDEGATCEASKTVTVGLIEALPIRSALTFPWDQVLPGRNYDAAVVITPKVCINGLGLKETYPQGWGITPLDNGGAQFREPNEWVWQGPVCPPPRVEDGGPPSEDGGPPSEDGGPPSEPGGDPKVTYRISVPGGTAAGHYAISGAVSSFSPRFEIRVGGLDTLEVVEKLPVEVAIACLDVAAGGPGPASCYNERGQAVITEAQIEQAKKLYHSGEPVPGTGGETIDYETMLRLLAYYETGTPVTQPLPQE
ncbi:MAG: PKD domain-containing protein, partial [Candidatus Bipolaricaulia bacterium]